MNDERFCYGFACTWFGSIHEVGNTVDHEYWQERRARGLDGDRSKLPCCPLCGGLLFEMPDEAAWWNGVDAFEAGTYPSEKVPPVPHPGYRAMFEWQRHNGMCFQDIRGLREAYHALTGIEVSVAA